MSGHSKWANIKHRKGKQDALKAKNATKIAREIMIAVKNGGDDPGINMKLKLALQKAKENNVPKENINRAIQRGLGGLEGENLETIMYEGYGPTGVAVLIEAVTDNRKRTVADIRHLFTKFGGNLGETGCVNWMFKNKGQFVFEKNERFDEDKITFIALEAGAEDVIVNKEEIEVICLPEEFITLSKAFEKNKLETIKAQLIMLPEINVHLTGEDAEKMMKLLNALDEHNDINEVYTNAEF